MSGRLVILRHKSWHVWNQDNREKVLRDERLHRESEEAKKAQEDRLIQDKNIEILRSSSLNNKPEENNSTVSNLSNAINDGVPFRLFEDLEQKESQKLLNGNPEYLKEKAEHERRQKQKEGVADWALGDGSFESKHVVPWYQQTRRTGMTTDQHDKEQVKKSSEDPMVKFIQPREPSSTHEHSTKNEINPVNLIPKTIPNDAKDRNSWEDISLEFPPSTTLSSSNKKRKYTDYEESHHQEHDQQQVKENTKETKDEKHHKKSSSKTHKKHDHHHKSSSSSSYSSLPKNFKIVDAESAAQYQAFAASYYASQNYTNCGQSIESLREKRLAREREEKKRVAQVLAQVDIYGPHHDNGDGKYVYSQQYHPTITRSSHLPPSSSYSYSSRPMIASQATRLRR